MSKEYNRCVICGKIGYALRESLTVCGEHMEAIDDGWTIEVKDGEYILVDLEEIDYPPAPAPQAIASPSATDDGDSGYPPLELEMHRMIPGLWRLTHKDGVASFELIAETGATNDSGYSELLTRIERQNQKARAGTRGGAVGVGIHQVGTVEDTRADHANALCYGDH